MSALGRWWQRFWSGPERPARVPEAPVGGGGGGGGGEPVREPHRRHYDAPPRDDDPAREADLGAVLQALAGGPLDRAALAARAGLDRDRLDAVVAHGVGTGVLRDDGAAVSARYAD